MNVVKRKAASAGGSSMCTPTACPEGKLHAVRCEHGKGVDFLPVH